MKSIVSLIFIVGILLLSAGSSWARFKIGPHLILAEEYTDNLFLSEDNEDDDWITTIEPGVAFIYDSASLAFDIDYALRFRYYQDNSDANETSLREVQRAIANASLFPDQDFTVVANGDISRVTVDERRPGVEESELVNTTNLYRFEVNPQYRWKLSPSFSATPGYRYEKYNYEVGDGDDTDSHEFSLLLDRKYSETTDLRLSYAFLDHQANFFQDFEQQTLTAGFTHQFSPQLTLQLDGGPARIDYADGTDKKWTAWEGQLVYNLSDALTLTLDYLRDFAVSVDRGLSESEDATAKLVYAGRATVEGRLYWTDKEFLEEGTEDKILGTALFLTVPLRDHYYTKFFGDYKDLEFNPGNEEADRYAAGATFGYAFNKLDVSLAYTYQTNDSNIETNDYRNNVVKLVGILRY